MQHAPTSCNDIENFSDIGECLQIVLEYEPWFLCSSHRMGFEPRSYRHGSCYGAQCEEVCRLETASVHFLPRILPGLLRSRCERLHSLESPQHSCIQSTFGMCRKKLQCPTARLLSCPSCNVCLLARTHMSTSWLRVLVGKGLEGYGANAGKRH